MGHHSMFIGLDVHKDTIDVSIADGHREGEVRHYGVIASDLEPLDKVVRALRAPDRRLHFVYEAGPCGFGIQRHLTHHGEDCIVVSPSMVPKRSGDRIKTDRRDSVTLARLHRAGELRAIYVPDAGDEAMRDLVRAREDAVVVGTQAKYRLKAFLLRQGRRYPGREGWTRAYRRWLADLSFPTAAQHTALQEYRDAIDETERRLERLTEQLRQLAPPWRWAPVVAALQALRGVSFVTAVALVAELGDLTRFRNPRELMAYLGLVPSEYSSGPSVRRGAITKAGNPHVRRLLAEAAWAYQGIPRIGRQHLYRQEPLPKRVCDIAWKAQLRLTGRFRRLVARGKAKPKVATAIARELTDGPELRDQCGELAGVDERRGPGGEGQRPLVKRAAQARQVLGAEDDRERRPTPR
jgi:transposase